MALHDFWCQECGQVLPDVNVPISVGATAGAPLHCGKPAAWIPQVGVMDASSGPGFEAFETRDAQNNLVQVDSLHKLRQLERDSERAYQNGEGAPLVFRRWANDKSNIDRHTLAPPGWTGGAQPDPAWVKKNAATVKRDMSVADTDYGPGVSDATPSALDALEK